MIQLVNSVALTGVAVGYVLLSPAIAQPLYNNLLFFPNYPTRYDEQRYQLTSLQGVPKKDLHIPTAAGSKMHAWYFQHPSAKQVVIIDHGNAGNLSDRTGLAADLLSMGVSVVLYDYQGYGLSGGVPGIRNICDDGVAVFDYVNQHLGFSRDNIILYGESLGCAVACNTASQRQCGGLILQSGFSSLKKIASEKFAFFNLYPSFFFPQPRLDNLSYLCGAHPPLLLIHGINDETIPVSHGEMMFQAAREPKRLVILPHSGHYVDELDAELFNREVSAFLASRRDVESAAHPVPAIN